MRVALDHHFFADFDAAGFADAANVVAAKVDEHDVFGDFFGICQQFLFERFVFFRGFATFACAGKRAHGDGIALDAGEDFRG